METFLGWTRTMKAKPSKCRSLAMKMMPLVNAQGKTTRSYVPYDPKPKIAGKEMPFIYQAPMRFFGEEIYMDLSDSEVRATVSAKFMDLLEKTDRDKVNHKGKLWIYENQVVSRITCEFITYCFPITFAEACRQPQTGTLKNGQGWKNLQTFPSCTEVEKRRDSK